MNIEQQGSDWVLTASEDNAVFVYDTDDYFVGVASPIDMIILPTEKSNGNYRSKELQIVFRDKYTAEAAMASIGEQIAGVSVITLTPALGEVFYTLS